MSEPTHSGRPSAQAEPEAAAQRLHVASVTGIDWGLAVAGLGGRSYAFVVDWHIRVVAALAWSALSSLVLYGDLLAVAADFDALAFFAVAVPALAIYVLYHPVLEVAMRGRTPGKRLAGVRVVTTDGQVPGAGALVVRNLLRIVDSLPALYAVGLVATFFTRQSVRIGDLAAGTVLVYEEDDAGPSAFEGGAVARLGLERTELLRELLQRWDSLKPDSRVELAGKLLRKDASDRPQGRLSEASLKAALEKELR